MAVRMVGSIPTALTGFEGLDRPRKRRIEGLLRRLAGAVDATGWALALFNRDGELLEHDVASAGIVARGALALLCAVPFPRTPGLVALPVLAASSGPQAVIAIALPAGPRHSLALVLLRASNAGEAGDAADAMTLLVAELARELSEAANRDGERRLPHPVRNGFQGFFLLNPSLMVERAWHSPDARTNGYAELVEPHDGRLPAIFERAVRRLTASWNFLRAGTCVPGIAYPLPDLMVKVAPMTGTDKETFVGAFVEQCADTHAIERAAAKFRISPREREVLHAMLDGNSVAEIAATLNLAESTVNDHIARMISKTNSRNRIEMAALFLGWPDIRNLGEPPPDERPSRGRVRCSWRYNIATTPIGNEPVG
jgi:DNA-binding CsgD family transcriptional regulator